jgi:hypothetical protein
MQQLRKENSGGEWSYFDPSNFSTLVTANHSIKPEEEKKLTIACTFSEKAYFIYRLFVSAISPIVSWPKHETPVIAPPSCICDEFTSLPAIGGQLKHSLKFEILDKPS